MLKSSALSCFAILFAAAGFFGCSKSNQQPAAGEPSITGLSSDPPIDLRVNWQIGARYVLRMEMKESSDFRRSAGDNGRGGRQLNLAHEYAITVTNDPATGLRGLDLELLSIEMEESAGERTFFNYDSQNRVTGTGGNPAAEQLERLVGGHLQYLIDSNQNVVSEHGLNELTARANPAPKTGERSRNRGIAGPVTRQVPAFETFKQLLALTPLPERQYRIGDSWPVRFKSSESPGGPIMISATNTFRGWQEHDRKKCARIELTGTVTPRRTNGNDQAGQRRGMLFNEATISGVCWIDPAASFLTHVTFDQSFNRSGTIGPQKRQGTNTPPQTFTAQTQQTISFKLIDMNPPAATSVSAN